MHLRAVYKAGRWDEMMERILDNEFHLPSFEIKDRNNDIFSRNRHHGGYVDEEAA